MKRSLLLLLLTLATNCMVQAQTAPDSIELTRLLRDFLTGVSKNDGSVHERFWADDLIYTRSSGKRIGKADILRDVRNAPAPKASDPVTIYTAEDIQIQQYDNTAIVAFRLVSTNGQGNAKQVSQFLNTGTFLKRNGQWRVVAWQATRIPGSELQSKQEVSVVESDFNQALLSGDVETLKRITDETFVWTHQTGQQMTKTELIEALLSGKLKYVKLTTNNVSISIYGDTAVVRGESMRQRLAIPGSPGETDKEPFKLLYTLTLTNQGGNWKAVALHSSRPQ